MLTKFTQLSCSWNNDVELSESLITIITDDQTIKQALFPSPGSNSSSSKGGGKPKTEFHWMICKLLFTNHSVYSEAFKKVELCNNAKKKAALRRTWGNKIKNRLVKYVPYSDSSIRCLTANGLCRMIKITNAHKETMGQTGQGISHRDQIDMSLLNELTTKWGA